MGWLFGDTPASLSKEVFAVFNKFRRLRSKLLDLEERKNEEFFSETESHQGNLLEIKRVFDQANSNELQRHGRVRDTLRGDLDTLKESLRVAEKVIKFAEED